MKKKCGKLLKRERKKEEEKKKSVKKAKKINMQTMSGKHDSMYIKCKDWIHDLCTGVGKKKTKKYICDICDRRHF